MKRNPLPIEDHANLGRELVQMRDQLSTLMVAVCHAYGPAHPAVRRLVRMHEHIGKVRSAMEDQSFLDHPKDATITTYYPMKG